MARSTRNLLVWTCVALLVTFVAQSHAALVLCVASDHTAVEPVHGGNGCAPGAHTLGAPESECTDTVLFQSSTPAAPERPALASPLAPAPVLLAAPAAQRVLARSAAAPPPRERERARSSTVLLL
jgi:hypothetical protein